MTEDERADIKQSFERNGYVVLRNVLPKETLEHLHTTIVTEFDRVQRSGDLFVAGGSISGHLNCFPGSQSRALYDILVEKGTVDLIHALLPKSLPVLNVGCNLNLPGSVAQHYHTDGAYLQEFIECNVAVIDTDLVNGAMEVAPSTHKKFYKYWQFVLAHVPRTRVVLRQGDVLIRTSNLWHRGMPNASMSPRPLLAFIWTQDGSRSDPFMENGGTILFKKNWYRTDILGQLRERAYVSAPFTYDAYRFARSFFGNRGYASY